MMMQDESLQLKPFFGIDWNVGEKHGDDYWTVNFTPFAIQFEFQRWECGVGWIFRFAFLLWAVAFGIIPDDPSEREQENKEPEVFHIPEHCVPYARTQEADRLWKELTDK